ncbi:MAG TPA: universal stress protein [Burkholderiales bacterium]|nr:universal stress protein [Burkholderiales bacterium]
MRRILLPVDGSLESLGAVNQAILEARAPEGVEVHLINVQPRTIPEESMVAIPAEDVDTYYYRRSVAALECAERCLHDAGVNFVSHHVVGPVAERILEKQRELGCDSILMSTHGHGRVANALLGSVSARVMRTARVPVVLVKAREVPDFTGRLGAT